jgi:uncharacterized protein YcbK (DUF882 family)
MSKLLTTSGLYDAPVSRRGFLSGLGTAAAAGLVWASPVRAAVTPISTGGELRDLDMFNQNTRETISTVFFCRGGYQKDSLNDLNHFLRDHHCNKSHWMDPNLLTMLYDIQTIFDKKQIEIISAYRAPETNAKLRHQIRGVAKDSLHMQGKAVDMRIRGVDVKMMYDVVKTLGVGGVGYHPRQNFVHLDTGPVRYWVG